VQDKTAPVISGVPASQTLAATSPAGAVATYAAPTATDAVDAAVPVTCSPASGSTFPIGSTTVTCTATDAAGNGASASFTITVQDKTAPVISNVPANQVLDVTSKEGAVATYALPTATDAIDGAVPVTCSPASGSTFAPGTTTVSCSATDAGGNTATASFTISVRFSWSGFKPPLDNGSPPRFNLGSVIPVKFELTGASANVVDAYVVLSWTKISGPGQGSGSSVVLYDPNSKQYVYNLDTTPLTKGTWRLALDLFDGVSRTIDVTLR